MMAPPSRSVLSITALPGHHLAHLAAWTQKGVRIIYLISFIWYFWIINVSICMMVDCKAHLVALTCEVGLGGLVLAMVAAPVVRSCGGSSGSCGGSVGTSGRVQGIAATLAGVTGPRTNRT